MKEIFFNPKEKEIILKSLQSRLDSFKTSSLGPHTFVKREKTINEVILKLNSELDGYYGRSHKLQINSCVNEFRYPYNELAIRLLNGHSIQFLKVEETDLVNLRLLDTCYGILQKTGHLKSKFRFSGVFSKIQKLKSCQTIWLSRTNLNHIWRIAFLSNSDEILMWETDYGLNIISDDFIKISPDRKTSLLERFSDYLSKDEARIIYEDSLAGKDINSNLQLVKYLLN